MNKEVLRWALSSPAIANMTLVWAGRHQFTSCTTPKWTIQRAHIKAFI